MRHAVVVRERHVGKKNTEHARRTEHERVICWLHDKWNSNRPSGSASLRMHWMWNILFEIERSLWKTNQGHLLSLFIDTVNSIHTVFYQLVSCMGGLIMLSLICTSRITMWKWIICLYHLNRNAITGKESELPVEHIIKWSLHQFKYSTKNMLWNAYQHHSVVNLSWNCNGLWCLQTRNPLG